MLQGTLVHYESRIQDLEKKVENLEWHNMRKSLVITGLYTEAKRAECMMQIQDFIEEEVGVEVEITDLFSWENRSRNQLCLQ